MKNLILGAVTRLSWSKIELFTLSRIKHCPDNDFVLFVKDVSDVVKTLLDSFKVNVIEIDDTFDILGHVNECRWLLYEQFLRNNREKYKQIFISDIRDAVFVGDVFSVFDDEKFICIAKEKGKFVGGGFYDDLIKEQYGQDNYDKMYGKNVFCGGTILGSSDEIYKLAKTMTRTMFGDEFPKFHRSDQSAYNYVIYNNLLPDANIYYSSTENGCMATLGMLSEEEVRAFQNGGSIGTKVAHQYDRWHDLVVEYSEDYKDVVYDVKQFDIGLRNLIDISYVNAKNGDVSNLLKSLSAALGILLNVVRTAKYVKWSYVYWEDVLAIYHAFIKSHSFTKETAGVLVVRAVCMEMLEKLPVGNISYEGILTLDEILTDVETLNEYKEKFSTMIDRVKHSLEQRRKI